MSQQQIEQFFQKTIESLIPLVLDIGGKLLGAIALWIVCLLYTSKAVELCPVTVSLLFS